MLHNAENEKKFLYTQIVKSSTVNTLNTCLTWWLVVASPAAEERIPASLNNRHQENTQYSDMSAMQTKTL
jgi:hypothetical protein